MATTTSQAAQAWHQAQKVRKHLLRQLEKMQKDNTSGVDLTQFESVDGLLEKLRLACVQTIFLDFDYAVAENTEQTLWSLHTSINTEYRRCLGRLKNSSNAVERRKVEKMYNNYLRIAQKFYKAYIQRLSARYDVRELKRVAQGIEVEQMTAEDAISPVPEDLSTKVLSSCHATLIRLGDLARYRIQARQKKSGYETALTYYSLAQDLVPDSGFAFHQMSIVNLDEGNHLDVVYHLYRAWAIATPHPNAKTNLESRFKTFQTMNSSSRHNPSTPQDVFAMWFVKLHALFYKGEVFSQHEELEGEVFHRLEMTAKDPQSTGLLLKMALVNISAHYIALSKYAGLFDSPPATWLRLTAAESRHANALRFYQYVTRLNLRFIHSIGGVLEKELRNAESLDVETGNGDKSPSKPLSVVEALLPTLRVYSMWLAASRQELFVASSDEHLGGLSTMTFRILAQVYTLLCVETYKQDNPATCPYLLAEDLEIRGLQPLAQDRVPEPCRCYCGNDGLWKPHPSTSKELFDTTRQRTARILDVLRCAYFMAEDQIVPLAYRVVDTGLVFEYQPQNATHPTQSANVTADPLNGVVEKSLVEPAVLTNQVQSNEDSSRSQQNVIEESHSRTHDIVERQDYPLSSEDDAAEDTVFNMLAPFLKPPTPQHQASWAATPAGPGSRVAGNVQSPSLLQPEPSPTESVRAGKFEPLPWNWVYTPTPHTAEELPSPTGATRFPSHYSPSHSKGPSFMDNTADNLFPSPRQPMAGSHGPQPYGIPLNPSTSRTTTDEAHRQQLLQSFVNGSAGRTSSSGNWAINQATPRQAMSTVPSPWGPQALDNPLSSGSTFSHPSSLYHGTPVNGVGPHPSATNQGQHLHPGQRDGGARQFQVDQTTSTYDAAILNAAYYGGR
ncbi:Protein SMG7 [Paramyrothecium foliicola]|nr:Protein SMG7 [Paramyrothecium foliicola]